MRKKVFCVMVLYMGLFSSCDKEEIGFEEPIIPPIEEPENPSVIPSTNGLIRVKIDDDVMAIVGNGMWRSICYGNGRYVAVGDSVRTESNGLNGRWGGATYSINGENWSTLISLAKGFGVGAYIESVAYGNGKFVAVGNADVNVNYARVTTSTDGINWSDGNKLLPSTNVSSAIEIIFVDGKFYLLTSGEFLTSTNGVNWDKLSDGTAGSYSITYGNGVFVVGFDGSVGTSTDGGITWTRYKVNVIQNYYNRIHGVAYGNGQFTTVDENGCVNTSTDGVIWTHATTIELPSSLDAFWCEWSRLRFIDGVFIAVGGSSYKEQKMCAYSTNGVNWKFIDELTGDGFAYNDLCSVR